MDITKCPHYEKTSYHKCKKYKELGLNCDCLENDVHTGFHDSKLCFFRENYYQLHPELYIQFGKYKYYEYKKIPDSYIAWLLKQNINGTLRKTLEDTIIEKNREYYIQEFISKNYKEHKPKTKYKQVTIFDALSRINQDLDYGGDLFDAMQGCGINGD